jgi:hypothetical protein
VKQEGNDPLLSCWIWTGYVAATGYGHMRRGQQAWLCHRYAYTILVGDIPDGLHLDHLCRQPACVNPWHLEPVSPRENFMRTLPHRKPPSRTHCVKGLHPFDEKNTFIQGGHRRCRACFNAAVRAYQRRQKAKAAA